MKVLVLGHSRIVQRRVLPALTGLEAVEGVEVASRRGTPADPTPGVAGWYDDFAGALQASDAELVYVSTVNSEHAEWAEAALDAGKHVIVDKPAVLDLGTAERLVTRAGEAGRCLAESVVYGAHPQIELTRRLFAEAEGEITRIACAFSMPPLQPDDFRYRAELGGGALWDLGPYAASVGRLFFDDVPEQIHAVPLSRRAGGVETAFSALLTYPGGRSLVGQFGFDTEYQNWITLFGPGVSLSYERVFTTPPDLENELRLRVRNETRVERAEAACPFTRFLGEVVASIGEETFDRYGEALLVDAQVVDALRCAAGV